MNYNSPLFTMTHFNIDKSKALVYRVDRAGEARFYLKMFKRVKTEPPLQTLYPIEKRLSAVEEKIVSSVKT